LSLFHDNRRWVTNSITFEFSICRAMI
jgi:hypothetical protein